jgi:homospermidine synthase
MTKHLIVGLGVVGKSFLRLLCETGLFQPEAFFCMDYNDKARDCFVRAGGLEENFSLAALTINNYQSILGEYSEGDYVFDFACDIRNLDVLAFAQEHKLHYLSVADSGWAVPDPNWTSAHQHYLEYVHLKKTKDSGATSIIEFGMNPGLVSCFVKKAIEAVVEFDQGEYVTKHRGKLKNLLKKRKYNVVAKKLQISYVIEVDNDDQMFAVSIPEENGTVFSPWSPIAFRSEALSCPEVMMGNRKLFYQYQEVRDCDFKDLYVSIKKPGVNCLETVYSPQGMTKGFLLTHEEVFTIARLLKAFRYRPTVFFIYSPCDVARKSVSCTASEEQVGFELLTNDMCVSGGESVGVIIQGNRFQTRYFGNYLNSEGLPETATVLQVSASALAAFQYMRKHPYEGLLFPEDVECDEVFEYVTSNIGGFISTPCPKVIPKLGK